MIFEVLLLIVLFAIFLVLSIIARFMWLELRRKHVVGKKRPQSSPVLRDFIYKAGR